MIDSTYAYRMSKNLIKMARKLFVPLEDGSLEAIAED